MGSGLWDEREILLRKLKNNTVMKAFSLRFLILLAVFSMVMGCTAPSTSLEGTATGLPEQTSAVTQTDELTEPTETAPTAAPESTPTPTPTATLPPEVQWEEALREALYQSSLKFIADTPEAADEVARQIGFVDGVSESAGNSCGPLSIAILKGAGLLPASTSVHDIWLLNLRDESYLTNILYRKYFPPQEYDYYWHPESIRSYDFQADPLLPGDWMFLFTAGNGFDHMLVVTRVDETGSPYTVTNIDRGDGFTISEEKLYDTEVENEGLLYELSDLEIRLKLGLTGTGGFLIVRRRGGLASTPALNLAIDPGLEDLATWHILVKDIESDTILFESLPNERFHPASMIKIPLAIVSLQVLIEKGYALSDLATLGYAGRTFDQLFNALIVNSEELAADELLSFVNENSYAPGALVNLGLEDTQFLPRSSTAYDLAFALENLYLGNYLPGEYNSYLINLMNVQTENDSQYFGVIKDGYPQIAFYNKRGLLLDPTIVSDMGILTLSDKPYVVVVNGTPRADGSATYEDIKDAIEKFALSLRNVLMDESTSNR